MNTQLNCLVVEDDPVDFQILEHHLRQAFPEGLCRRVERLADLAAALAPGGWDVILSDYIVPGLDPLDTLAFLQARHPGLPLILVSGAIGEEKAVELLKLGVSDVVLKDNLRRLVPAIERSQREAAGLRQRLAAEARYRFLFDHMLNGCAHGRLIFEQDQPADFVYLDVNPAFAQLTGKKSVVGRRVTEVIPGLLAGNPGFFEPYGRVVRTGVPEKYESYIPALQQWFAVALYRTTPDHFVVVFDVITERKLAEESLRRSQAVYHSLVTQLPVGIYQKDREGRYVVVNPTLCELRGLPADAFLGKSAQEVAGAESAKAGSGALAFPEALAREDHHRQILETGRPIELEEEFILPDGRRELMHVMKLPVLDLEGQVIGTQGVLFNITERKARTEELLWKTAFLEALVHSSADGILVVDNQGRKMLQNQKMVDFWKLPPEIAAQADERQQFEFALTQARDPAQLAARFERVQAHPDAPDQAETELMDGTVLDRYTAQVRGQDGKVYGRLWTFHNITRARQLEAQYHQAQKMEAVGTLAGGIAHDFNNILCAMFGYGYLAQQELAGHPLALEHLAEILKSANRAKDLVQQILTFSRQREQKREAIRLETVITEAAKFLRASFPADLQIEINLDDQAPAVLADPTQIYLVVMNLATNALHAMEGRPGHLAITLSALVPDEAFLHAHPEIPPNHYARLTVADTGRGMDERTRGRIFEPFFTTKAVGKGTGLGLAVVHGIVQSHEGFVTVTSLPGRGATFELIFPAQNAAALAPENPVGHLPRGAGQNILLLDDEPALTGAFKSLLERLNYRVATCHLPSEALRRFRASPAQFDLVITDLTMPEISGLELARQLHGIRADLPVILATGHACSLSDAPLKAAGITELLGKPLILRDLALAVQRALTRIK